MKKAYINDLKPLFNGVVSDNGKSYIISLSNGDVLKIFVPFYCHIFTNKGITLERKILESKVRENSSIISPKIAVYNSDGSFTGYTMEKARGTSFANYFKNLTTGEKNNLELVTTLYKSLEDTVRREENAVFPDLCTFDNLFIAKDNSFQVIDYDGIQIDNYHSIILSQDLINIEGEEAIIENPKYCRNSLFTKNLDKKSLAFYYFVLLFNIPLSVVGKYSPIFQKVITLNELFYITGLDDSTITNKIINMFTSSKDDEYLSDDVFRICDKYTLENVPFRTNKGKEVAIRRLVKKSQ